MYWQLVDENNPELSEEYSKFQMYYSHGFYDDAIDIVNDLIDFDEENPYFLFLRAKCREKLGLNDGALEDIDLCAEMCWDEDAVGLTNCAEFYLHKFMFEKAKETFESAECCIYENDLNEKEQDELRLDVLLGIAECCMEMHDFVEAKSYLDEAHDGNEGNENVLLLAGQCAFQMGDMSEALVYLKEVIKINQSNPVPHVALGAIYAMTGNIVVALGEFQFLKTYGYHELADIVFSMIYPPIGPEFKLPSIEEFWEFASKKAGRKKSKENPFFLVKKDKEDITDPENE